ncbi:MAG: hypothetical protein MUD12_06790 [Spirochaetes bacterium]|jgi:hypothetical protein|nr:hypothetical protein [Spirochaetota bacterium]
MMEKEAETQKEKIMKCGSDFCIYRIFDEDAAPDAGMCKYCERFMQRQKLFLNNVG